MAIKGCDPDLAERTTDSVDFPYVYDDDGDDDVDVEHAYYLKKPEEVVKTQGEVEVKTEHVWVVDKEVAE